MSWPRGYTSPITGEQFKRLQKAGRRSSSREVNTDGEYWLSKYPNHTQYVLTFYCWMEVTMYWCWCWNLRKTTLPFSQTQQARHWFFEWWSSGNTMHWEIFSRLISWAHHPIPSSCGVPCFEVDILCKGVEGYTPFLPLLNIVLLRLGSIALLFQIISRDIERDHANIMVHPTRRGKSYGPKFTTLRWCPILH